MQVGVAGRPADLVVDGQLGDPGAVEQPAQDQDRLPVTAQRPGSGPGPEPPAFGVQQSRTRTTRCVRIRAGWRCM